MVICENLCGALGALLDPEKAHRSENEASISDALPFHMTPDPIFQHKIQLSNQLVRQGRESISWRGGPPAALRGNVRTEWGSSSTARACFEAVVVR
jgi:hypothetical protein